MAIKHLINYGIGYSVSGEYPRFLVTLGLSIGEEAASNPKIVRVSGTLQRTVHLESLLQRTLHRSTIR